MPHRRCLVGCEMSGEVRDALAATGYWDEVWSADILPTEKLPDALVTPGQQTVFNGRTHPGSDVFTGHYQGDVLDLFKPEHPVNESRFIDIQCGYEADLWTLFIGHPPCTHLALSGAVWWKGKRATPGENRPSWWPAGEFFSVQDDAACFFLEMLKAPARYVAVENPRGDMTRRYRPPDQYVQPHMFGDPLVKATGLWLKGLPLLYADNPVEPLPDGRVTTGGGSHRTDMKRNGRSSNRHEDGKGRVNRQRERNRTLPGLARAMATQWTSFIREQEERAA